MHQLSAWSRLSIWALCVCFAVTLAACGEESGDSQQQPTVDVGVGDDAMTTSSGGGGDDGMSSSGGDTVTPNPDACAADPTPLRRLSHFEFRNTIRDLFPTLDPTLITLDSLGLPADNRPHEFDNDAEGTLPTPALIERYMEVGRVIAETLGADVVNLVECTPADQSEAEIVRCGQTFLRDFGKRVFRRPLTDEEVETFTSIDAPGLPLFGVGTVTRPRHFGVELTYSF